MSATRPLHRTSTVDALATALRRQILDGEPAPGALARPSVLRDHLRRSAETLAYA